MTPPKTKEEIREKLEEEFGYIETSMRHIMEYVLKALDEYGREIAKKIEAKILGLRKDSAGGYSVFSKGTCKWCGAKEAEYHKSPCKILEAVIFNSALSEAAKTVRGEGK